MSNKYFSFNSMKRLFLNLTSLVFILSFLACSPDPKEAFKTLKQLEGTWKSTGSVIVFESWALENDSLLTGYQFSNRGENRLVLERYRLERNRDSILFVILRPAKAIGEDKFPLIKSRFGAFTFENPNATYPNRILIDFDNDSTFVFRKENSRGKKSIEFEMKRLKE